MTTYRYVRFDGSDEFTPQSADALFDEFSNYLLEFGEEMLQNLDVWNEEHPDVIEMLVKQGLIERDESGRFAVTPKGLKRVEHKSLEALFDVSRKDRHGKHETDFRGAGQTVHEETRRYEFGDPIANLNLHETLRNAIGRGAGGIPIGIGEEDFVVHETEYQTNCATVVLLDMSGSMTRGGKFGRAKQVAMALRGLVRGRFPGDSLQTVGFYTYASALSERDVLYAAPKPVSIFDPRVRLRIPLDRPPGFVPEHFTNIHAGLQFARRLLARQPAANRQIICITDGEPTAHVEGRDILLVYPPAEKTARATLAEAKRCANQGIHISSFALIDDYFYLGLVNFVEQMAHASGGIAAYCNANDLGDLVIESFNRGRHRKRAI